MDDDEEEPKEDNGVSTKSDFNVIKMTEAVIGNIDLLQN